MRARQPPRTTGSKGRAIAFAAWLAGGLLGCGGSTPMDMWLTKDPDAGAGYVAPMREAGAESDASGGTGGAGGQGGDTGAAGTTGAGGDTGSAGASGGQGGDGQGGDTGGASAGGTGGSN